MAHDASEILGSPQLAGVKVNPRGMAKRVGANSVGMYAGAVGAVVSATAAGRASKQQAKFEQEAQTPKFGRLAYLAVTGSELALVELNTKGMGLVLGEVLVRLPRSDVAGAELGGGHTLMSPPLTITFTAGERWELEVPRPSKKDAQEVASVLSGALPSGLS
jgi:hypothetical protein